jgi:hypothetical protein
MPMPVFVRSCRLRVKVFAISSLGLLKIYCVITSFFIETILK